MGSCDVYRDSSPLLIGASFVNDWIAAHLHLAVPGPKGVELHPLLMIVIETLFLIAVLIATAVMARLENRRVASYGLLGVDRIKQFIIGLVSGFVSLSLLVGILLETHHLQLSIVQMPGITALSYGAAWGLVYLLVGIMEELMVRGYLLFKLACGIHFWPAAVLLAVVFGLLHKGNGGESPFGLVAAGLVGLVFSLSLWRLGHLWWAIGFHTTWDWAESVLLRHGEQRHGFRRPLDERASGRIDSAQRRCHRTGR